MHVIVILSIKLPKQAKPIRRVASLTNRLFAHRFKSHHELKRARRIGLERFRFRVLASRHQPGLFISKIDGQNVTNDQWLDILSQPFPAPFNSSSSAHFLVKRLSSDSLNLIIISLRNRREELLNDPRRLRRELTQVASTQLDSLDYIDRKRATTNCNTRRSNCRTFQNRIVICAFPLSYFTFKANAYFQI